MRRFLSWLGDRSPVDGDPLADEAARDWAVRDYKRHLKAVERFKPSSVNLALAALDSFYARRRFAPPGHCDDGGQGPQTPSARASAVAGTSTWTSPVRISTSAFCSSPA